MKYFLVIVVVLLVNLQPLSADDKQSENLIDFSLSISKDTLNIGDNFTIDLIADYPDTIELSEPVAKAAKGYFMIKSESVTKSEMKNGRISEKYTIKLSAFDTGELGIPIFEFFWYDDEGNQHIEISPSRNIYVNSILPADTAGLEIKDIIGPKSLPVRWWLYVIIGLTIIAVGIIIYIFYKKKTRDISIPEVPPEPPYEIAIRRLIRLKEKNLPAKGKIKQYYIELSDIVRHYIQGRFDIVAIEATTYELKYQLKHPELPRDKSDELLKLLIRSDMVKFAKYIPETSIIDEDYTFAQGFAVATKPIEVIEESTNISGAAK